MIFLVVAILAVLIVFFLAWLLRPRPVNDGVRPAKVFKDCECPLCLQQFTWQVQTSCGHVFCAECILQVWQKYPNLTCPVCREQISILFSDFDESGAPDQILRKIAQFNLQHSKSRSYWQIFKESFVIEQRLFNNFRADTVMVYWKSILILAAGVAYVFLPIDLLPEEYLGYIGAIDDIIILVVSVVASSVAYYDRENQRARERVRDNPLNIRD